jgi:uncharacterized protein YcbX
MASGRVPITTTAFAFAFALMETDPNDDVRCGMRVSQLWRSPVKSMIGGMVDVVDLDELGVVGDRTWATRDLERGGIRGAKKIGSLMRLAARDLDGGHVEITLPDGTTTRTSDPDVHDRVSAALDQRVRLERLAPVDDLDHYRRGAPDSNDFVEELRGIFGREADEPLPDFSIFPPAIAEFESPPGTYYDVFPLLVMTEAALGALAAGLPESTLDVRRFRPSIVIDTGDAGSDAPTPGHPEFDWAGRRARLGTAVIEFGVPCPRCVMITRQIDASIPADRDVLRYVVRELDQNVGVYATIVEPGIVNVGDELIFD